MLEIIFHKEPERIGGGITEIKYDEHRLLIDMGAELNPPPFGNALDADIHELNPMIEGVTIGEANCDAVLISHYHGDHIGLLRYVLPEVPIYMSKTCRDISLTIQNRLKKAGLCDKGDNTIDALTRAEIFTQKHFGQDQKIGPFTVRPIRVDHSAFDALAFLITVGGKRIFFTGDFRSHGYTGKKFAKLLECYVGKVDALLIEGTMLSRKDEAFSEWELSKKMQELCAQHKYVLYLGSSTNIDSIYSIANATIANNKKLGMDEYQKEILQIIAANSTSSFYQRNFEQQDSHRNGSVIFIRMSELKFAKKFYEKYGQDSILIYSLWKGYIKRNEELQALAEQWGERFIPLHSGGHASVATLKTAIDICADDHTLILPMHVEAAADFEKITQHGKVIILHKGERIEL